MGLIIKSATEKEPCRKSRATLYKRYWSLQKILDDIQRIGKRYSTISDDIIQKRLSAVGGEPFCCSFSFIPRRINLLFKGRAIRRTYDLAAGEDLLYSVRAPAGNSRDGEKRGIEILRNIKHFIHQSGIHIHIGTNGSGQMLAFHYHRLSDTFDALHEVEHIGIALFLCQIS